MMKNRDIASQSMRKFEIENGLPEAELYEKENALFGVSPDGLIYALGWVGRADDIREYP